jgi:hypothetical protein
MCDVIHRVGRCIKLALRVTRLSTPTPTSTEGGPPPPPQRFLRSCWAGEGLSAYQEGQMGHNFVRFGQLETQRDTVKTSR